MEKIKILQVVPSLSQSNGVAAYVSNYFINMPKENINMTFLVVKNREHDRFDEIEKNGGKIVECYSEKGIFSYLKKIDAFFKNNQFDIVHCHVPNYATIMMHYAKKYNVNVRILHSHVNKSSDVLSHKIVNDIITPFAIKNSNHYFACSDIAGKFLFKNRKFDIVNNAIDLQKYSFDNEKREKARKELSVENNFVIGEFGRLCNQKNQLFMLDIFNEILKKKPNSILLLAGIGPLQEKVEEKIKSLKIEENVQLLGTRKDLDYLYNALDAYVMPSIYEGLGIVLVEAQTNGLKSYTSADVVPKVAQVTDLLKFISLEKKPEEWADIILNDVENGYDRNNYDIKEIADKGFDIKKEADLLYKRYVTLYEESEKGKC